MSIVFTLLAAAPVLAGTPPGGGGLVAIKVGRAETVTHGTIEHAVILVDQGRIVAVGQDLPIERGIPVVDRPEWVAMPGLVNPYSRTGLDSRSGSDFSPEVSPTAEILPRHREYAELLEAGVTTLGVYPPGTGVPGHAVVLHPRGDTLAEMLHEGEEPGRAYLKVYFRSDARSKKMVKDAWEKVDEHDEKVKKAKEKFDKESEKKKPSSADKKDDKKDEKGTDGKEPPKDGEGEKKDDAKDAKAPAGKTFVPPAPDPKIEPFVALRDGDLRALVSIGQSSDWLHWLDAIGEREFEFALRVPMTRELDLFEIKKELGQREVRIVMEPELTLHPGTMRQRNLPMELDALGARIVLIPRNDTVNDHENWLRHVGELVRAGLERETALEAVTLGGAAVLGVDGDLGSLDAGKRADLVFFDGDPFEATTRVQAVMLEGEFVSGEVRE